MSGGLNSEFRKRFPHIALGAPWRRSPPPGTDDDVDQAIAAKLYLAARMAPLLVHAQLLGVEPLVGELVPVPAPLDELLSYAPRTELAASPLFLDLESAGGGALAWEQETWPLPFHLRGALCWRDSIGLCVIPFGSVAGKHLIGGTDYQPWARLIFIASRSDTAWPSPGPGDVFVNPNGAMHGWVELDSDSACAHQASVATNLALGAVSLLMLLERLEVPLVERPLPRPARRRAQRDNQRIGLVPKGLPQVTRRHTDRHLPALSRLEADAAVECPIHGAHARLNQAHVFWHEALVAYDDADLFVAKLNALLTALRSVTFVLQKELRHVAGFSDWYGEWQEKMKADPLMTWLVKARNAIEKEGDLDTASVAVVTIESGWRTSAETLIEVDPTDDSATIARRVLVSGRLPDRVRREGVVVVERRWTVGSIGGQEILDVLANCFGVLAKGVAEAHTRAGSPIEQCETSDDDEHHAAVFALLPSGRAPCMAASREARTSRRNLSSGELISVGLHPIARGRESDVEEAAERYEMTDADVIPADVDLVEQTRRMHGIGRKILLKDGYHRTIAWLHRDGTPAGLLVLTPEDQREKHLMLERLATQITKTSADAVIFVGETWDAPQVPPDDTRARLRAEEREDRTEHLMTCLLRRNGEPVIFSSHILRDEGGLTLGKVEELVGEPPPFFGPILRAWDGWPT